MIFDGNNFAQELTRELIEKISRLVRKPVLASIYNPEDIASRVYTDIKARKADELGIEFRKFEIRNLKFEINELIIKINNDANVDGIMIQTPLIDRETDKKLCEMINPKKDCDGLNPESGVVPATVKAVLKILALATPSVSPPNLGGEARSGGSMVVVGQRGLVGSELLKRLPGANGMSANELNIEELTSADVVISATGRQGLIKPEMIREGAVCIDVGYPKGDFAPECARKAGFFTPVPGGVGPVTVVCLFDNLLELING